MHCDLNFRAGSSQLLSDGRRARQVEPVYEPMAQYSSANMIVIIRLVMAWSDGSGE
jgi:hypothetical protein